MKALYRNGAFRAVEDEPQGPHAPVSGPPAIDDGRPKNPPWRGGKWTKSPGGDWWIPDPAFPEPPLDPLPPGVEWAWEEGRGWIPKPTAPPPPPSSFPPVPLPPPHRGGVGPPITGGVDGPDGAVIGPLVGPRPPLSGVPPGPARENPVPPGAGGGLNKIREEAAKPIRDRLVPVPPVRVR
jgi:hypothetical protein